MKDLTATWQDCSKDPGRGYSHYWILSRAEYVRGEDGTVYAYIPCADCPVTIRHRVNDYGHQWED